MIAEPCLAGSLFIVMVSVSVTLYCFPPTCTIANFGTLISQFEASWARSVASSTWRVESFLNKLENFKPRCGSTLLKGVSTLGGKAGKIDWKEKGLFDVRQATSGRDSTAAFPLAHWATYLAVEMVWRNITEDMVKTGKELVTLVTTTRFENKMLSITQGAVLLLPHPFYKVDMRAPRSAWGYAHRVVVSEELEHVDRFWIRNITCLCVHVEDSTVWKKKKAFRQVQYHRPSFGVLEDGRGYWNANICFNIKRDVNYNDLSTNKRLNHDRSDVSLVHNAFVHQE